MVFSIRNIEKTETMTGYRSLACERGETMRHAGTWKNSVLGRERANTNVLRQSHAWFVRGRAKWLGLLARVKAVGDEVRELPVGLVTRPCSIVWTLLFPLSEKDFEQRNSMIWLVSLQDHSLCHVENELGGTRVEKGRPVRRLLL